MRKKNTICKGEEQYCFSPLLFKRNLAMPLLPCMKQKKKK